MPTSILAKRGWLLLFLAIAAFYFYGLGAIPFVGPDEPLYAEVAREMFVRADLITPMLGGHFWFEKPPLLYWFMIAGYRGLGIGEYAARLGPAISGLVTAVFIFWIGKAINLTSVVNANAASERGDFGRFSALVWLSSLGALIFSRGASFDTMITMSVAAALACFFIWHLKSLRDNLVDPKNSLPSPGGTKARVWLLLGFYFFIGVSLLAKGLVGAVITFSVIAVYFFIRREWPQARFLKSLLWGIPLTLLVAGVWYGPMIHRHGWRFIDQFIIQHHLVRYVTNKYHQPRPFYYYVPVLALLSLPWTVFLGAAFASARKWQWRGNTPADRLRVFATAWILVPFLFFSASQSKLLAYLLPVLPAVSLLVGDRIDCFLRMQRGDRVLRLTGAMLVGSTAIGVWYAVSVLHLSIFCGVAMVIPLIIAGAAAVVRPQKRKPIILAIPIALFVTSLIALHCGAPTVARSQSARDLLKQATTRGYGATPVVQFHTLERTAEFYAAGRISYGSMGEPIQLEEIAQVLEAARRNGGVVLCFVPIEYVTQLTDSQQVRVEVIGNNGRVSLVVVQAL